MTETIGGTAWSAASGPRRTLGRSQRGGDGRELLANVWRNLAADAADPDRLVVEAQLNVTLREGALQQTSGLPSRLPVDALHRRDQDVRSEIGAIGVRSDPPQTPRRLPAESAPNP